MGNAVEATTQCSECHISLSSRKIVQSITIGDPSALAMGSFATTLLTLSLSMMKFRGFETENMNIGNLCFVSGVGLFVSAQWEILRGNSFTYTVLGAFGLFYAAYGAMMIPWFGVVDAYGGITTPAYQNAMGFFILIWAVFNLFFWVCSFAMSIIYVLVFSAIELCLLLDAASYFAYADGAARTGTGFKTSAGAFAFAAGLLGYYCLAHYLFKDTLGVVVPMGDLTAFRDRRLTKKNRIL